MQKGIFRAKKRINRFTVTRPALSPVTSKMGSVYTKVDTHRISWNNYIVD